jgi:hypothetical protein
MTVQQLFDLTIGMMGMNSSNASTYLETVIPQVNVILSACYNLENNNRLFNEVTLLTAIPTVASLTDPIVYYDDIQRKAMMWGLAELFALSDDDTLRATVFSIRFADAQKELSKLIPSDITDYYSTEEE